MKNGVKNVQIAGYNGARTLIVSFLGLRCYLACAIVWGYRLFFVRSTHSCINSHKIRWNIVCWITSLIPENYMLYTNNLYFYLKMQEWMFLTKNNLHWHKWEKVYFLTHQAWESRLHLQEACHKSPASASWMATASFCKHFFTLFRLYGFLLSSLHQN